MSWINKKRKLRKNEELNSNSIYYLNGLPVFNYLNVNSINNFSPYLNKYEDYS